MTNTTNDLYVRADFGSHTITYWHGELLVSRPVGDGAWAQHYAHCWHHHTEHSAAKACAARAERFAERNNGKLPTGWVEGVRP